MVNFCWLGREAKDRIVLVLCCLLLCSVVGWLVGLCFVDLLLLACSFSVTNTNSKTSVATRNWWLLCDVHRNDVQYVQYSVYFTNRVSKMQDRTNSSAKPDLVILGSYSNTDVCIRTCVLRVEDDSTLRTGTVD